MFWRTNRRSKFKLSIELLWVILTFASQIVDPVDRTKKAVSFACTAAVAARHIGFAIGPFEYIDLANIRESEEDEKLGQNAVQLHGYCLPERMDELRNTCFPTSKVCMILLASSLLSKADG